MTQYEKLVVSAYTGYGMVSLGDLRDFATKVLDRPVMSHEFASGDIYKELREKLEPDFIKLCKEDTPQIQQTLTPDQELYTLMKLCFAELSDTVFADTNQEIQEHNFATACAPFISPDSENFENLRQFMMKNDISTFNEIFSECFQNVKRDYFEEHPGKNRFNLNARIIDDDGFKGKIVAYNPQANMYKVDHELVNGRLPVANGWYPPERLRAAPEEKQVASVDNLISQATAISEQSKGLADDLRNRLKYEELLND